MFWYLETLSRKGGEGSKFISPAMFFGCVYQLFCHKPRYVTRVWDMMVAFKDAVGNINVRASTRNKTAALNTFTRRRFIVLGSLLHEEKEAIKTKLDVSSSWFEKPYGVITWSWGETYQLVSGEGTLSEKLDEFMKMAEQKYGPPPVQIENTSKSKNMQKQGAST